MPKSVNYSELFELSDPGATRPLRLAPREQKWINDDTAWRLFIGEWQPPEPVILKGVMGGMPADFLWTTFPPLVCISKRVVKLLRQKIFTGWAVYPVKVFDRDGHFLPDYYGFSVKSSVGKQDINRSLVVSKPPIMPGGKSYQVYKGMYFDETKWLGSDIFRVEAAFIVVTQRVRETFIRAKVSNVHFISLTESEMNVSLYNFGNIK